MADQTKKELAKSLKKLLEKKTLKDIKISDITEKCGLNRHTFYYYFQDIYALIEWIYKEDADKVIGENKKYDNWQDGFYYVFEYLQDNKKFVKHTYNSLSREYLENYLYKKTYKLLIDVINDLSKEIEISDEDKAFIANFHKYAFVGLIIEWIQSGMKTDPNEITKKLSILLEGNFKDELLKFKK